MIKKSIFYYLRFLWKIRDKNNFLMFHTWFLRPYLLKTFTYRADPRQDPLLGPLLAELDAMTTQQQRITQPPPPVPVYRRNSVPYEPNLARPTGLSQSNHGRILYSISNKRCPS